MTADGAPPIEEACYWLARAAHAARVAGDESELPARERRRDTDIAIVGAGFTGLWTALFLKQLDPSVDVVIVEQGTTAYGASGRNAGMVSATIDHSHGLAVAHFGQGEAQRLAVLGLQNVEEMFTFLEAHDIECDLERSGTLHVALSTSHLDDLQADVACAESLGVRDLRLLDRDETRAQIHSPRYEGALFDPSGAVLDPVRLALGLRRVAAALGVTILEQTPVLALEDAGDTVRLRTADGEVVARRVILATSAYTHHLLPIVRSRMIPLYDYVLVSEPLTPAQHETIGWRGRQGVTDVRTFFNYYRMTKDNRVLWGTSDAAYYGNNRTDVSCDHSERHYSELRESFAHHFPALSDLDFPYAWGGAICATTRFTPFFGRAHDGRVLYGLGYTGHGLATTHLAGKILAHMAFERQSPLLDLALVREKPLPYPPEPLRTWAVNAVTRDLRRVDAGNPPSMLLRVLDALGMGLSS